MAQDSNNYWEQLERLEKLIRASELKAGVIFSFHSLILGLFVDRLGDFKGVIVSSNLLIILAVLWVLSVLISIFYCFKCFMPRIESKYEKNVFFFKDAASSFGDLEAYTKELIRICGSDQEFYRQLANQIHVESKIIERKFSSVQMSIRFFALSFLFIILFILVWLIQM